MRYIKIILDYFVVFSFCFIIDLASCAAITYDASSSLTITKSLSSPSNSIVIITKKSNRVGDTFAFQSHSGPNPRIFLVKKVQRSRTGHNSSLICPSCRGSFLSLRNCCYWQCPSCNCQSYH